ncbi:hypothetical protein T484DRAFT_1631912, partial [Baffinella frigidus]
MVLLGHLCLKLGVVWWQPELKRIFNSRQLAYKISCNSIYGFCGTCGAVAGLLPCVPLAATVTAIGRGLINNTRGLRYEIYPPSSTPGGEPCTVHSEPLNSKTVHFDQAMEYAMELGKDAAKLVTQHFAAPISLEFEKAYCPFFLFSKKRYAGLLFASNPVTADKTDLKGVESVRRDSCEMVQEVSS